MVLNSVTYPRPQTPVYWYCYDHPDHPIGVSVGGTVTQMRCPICSRLDERVKKLKKEMNTPFAKMVANKRRFR